MLITLVRIFKAGFNNFLRNAWLSTAATAVMTVTLSIILTTFISNAVMSSTIKALVNKIDVSVYLADSTNPEQVKNLQERLTKLENVQSVRFISKTEALAIYREQNKNDPELLEAVTEAENPLPASFAVKVKDQKKLEPIAQLVEQNDVKPLLDPKNPTSYQGDRKATIDKIVKASNFLRTTGLVATIIFVTISTLIIFNTIRMAIFTRREEIEIMKLVGATNWFIRGPFLFEAALYGIIAALIAVGLSYTTFLAGGPKLATAGIDVNSTLSFFRSYPFLIIMTELGIGILIGSASSMLAMIRYLKL